jgi:PAS domain S-box-containing protein
VDDATIGTARNSQAGYSLVREDPVVTADLSHEDRFSADEILVSGNVTSGISVVVGSPDDPWGVLGTHDTDRQSFADHDVQFVQSIAHILATAIDRHERELALERGEAMLDAVGDGVYALDENSRFLAVNDAYCEMTGYDRAELLGTHSSTITGGDVHGEASRLQTELDDEDEVTTLETTLPTEDGTELPIEARISLFPTENGEYGRVGVVRDVSDRERREEKLTSLTEMLGSLAETETPESICDVAVNAAVEVLGFPNAAVALYDDEANALAPTVRRWEGDGVDDLLLGTRGDDVAWQTFVENESRVYDDLGAEMHQEGDGTTPDGDAGLDADAGSDEAPALSSVIAVPLGKHGVFLAAAPERAAFDPTDASLADLLCSNVRSALARAEREVTLREQRDDLRAKNRELERVNRLNEVIRELTKAVTQASTEADVMQATCDRLAESGPYRFAWFGEYDRTADDVRQRASAGVGGVTAEDANLDVTATADADDPRGRGPVGRAVRRSEVQVQNDLLGDPPFEPWRERALEQGFRSCVAVPVVYGGSLRGVLTVYADEPDAFNEKERTVLAELGETIGYALSAIERKEALVSERSIELDFRVQGTETPVIDFVSETGARLEFEDAVQRDDGRLHAFFTIRKVPIEQLIAFAEDQSWIEEVRLVAEHEDGGLYECTLGDESFLRTLVDRGALPRSITISEGEGRFVVRIPQGGDVRTFVDLFESYFERVELVARRERDEPVLTRREFEVELRERLTDRQEEVLQMAYFGGFFGWPRESTAEEIADALDVTQPTVSRHVRAAERELFGLLFED